MELVRTRSKSLCHCVSHFCHCEGAKRTKQSIILHTENFTMESLEYKGVHYYRLPRFR
ncbi:hypothetical protein [Helicobacter rodentium]|uniref:hypothetical protein n=1 Tax=Helicobacter rodentium TaxID=59617 RepID=UPI000A8EEEDB|nr:hypothetical protein [Helicobacter rodentium]